MAGQQTLEEVGVKRARIDEGANTNSNSKDGQPDAKKAHSQAEGSQQTSPAATKENQGSNTNAKADEKPNAKVAAADKTEQNKPSTPKGTAKAETNGKTEPDQDGAPKSTAKAADAEPKAKTSNNSDPQAKAEVKEEAAPTEEADAKAELPDTSVPKPEGVVEEGRIYFLYRPRVNVDHPTSIDDIQRFFIILAPASRPQAPFRLLIIGKKRLPTAEGHERFFGYVQGTADKMEKLTGGLGETGNQTASMGYRSTEPARVCGEGVYSIVDRGGCRTATVYHLSTSVLRVNLSSSSGRELVAVAAGVYSIVDRGGRRTSIAYKLEIPKEPGEVQKELQIRQEASYTLSIKNPGTNDPPNAGLNNKADYKGSQKKQFGGYRWIGCHDPSLLDMERCEFLFIGARGGEDIKNALGDAAVHLEKAAEEDLDNYMQNVAPDGVDEHTAMLAKLRDETKAAEGNLPTEPAATGKWQ